MLELQTDGKKFTMFSSRERCCKLLSVSTLLCMISHPQARLWVAWGHNPHMDDSWYLKISLYKNICDTETQKLFDKNIEYL